MQVWGSVVTFAIWALGSLFITFANRGTSYGDLMSYLQKEQKENVSIQLQHHFL